MSFAQRASYCDSLQQGFTASVNGSKASFKPYSSGKILKLEWNFGDGTSSNDFYPNHTYQKYGHYKVCLTFKVYNIRDTSKPCITTICDSINIKDPCANFNPKASITVDSNGLAVFKADYDSNYKYLWTFGDGSSSSDNDGKHQYKNGTYQACVKILDKTTNCYKTICFNLTVGSDPCKNFKPYVSFYMDSTGTLYFYGDTSSNLKYYWDFGDNTVSDAKYGHHTYKAGTYKMCVTVYDKNTQCSIKICETYTVKGSDPCDKFKPGAHFKLDSTGLLHYEADSGQNWVYGWDFGDNTSSKLRLGTHQYKPGIYKVCVLVYEPSTRCTKTICETIYVHGKDSCDLFQPRIEFKNNGNGVYTFWGAGTGAANYKYSWIFGDSTTGTGMQITHTYKPGKYVFCVVITDPKTNCTKTICETLNVGNDSCKYFNPSFGFKVDGMVIYYEASKGDSFSYNWTFGNIGSSTDRHGKFDFKKPGKYLVCVTIKDNKTGCVKSVCKWVVLRKKDTSDPCKNFNPKVSFKINNGTVEFSVNGTKNAKYLWDFGDSSKRSDSRNPVHKYTKAGKYTVCVIIYDAKRKCTKKECFSIEIKHSSSDPCDKFKPKFAYSVKGNYVLVEADKMTGVQYFWNWGDKQTDTGRVADHTYKRDGKYTICLTAYDSSTRCKKTVCSTVILKQQFILPNNGDKDYLNVYPNPAVNEVSVETKEYSEARISVKDVHGVEVLSYKATPDSQKKVNIMINELPKGLYFIYVEQNGKVNTTKFMK